MTDTIPEHLGGFLSGPHGDEATWFPDMWRWVVKELDIKSVLDIGCGEGHSLRHFVSLDAFPVLGIDGVEQEHLRPDFRLHDYTTGPWEPNARVDYDLGWCCEFLEHIEERFLPNLVTTFQSCNVLLVTHAFPGQLGHHHVNCQPREYWLGFFAGIGFAFDPDLTYESKRYAAQNTSPWNHWTRSGLVFRRLDG